MTHAEKLKRIEYLMASPDVLELNALVDEVEAFEKTACPVPAPTLPEAMRFRRDQMGETQREMSARAGVPLARWQMLESGKVPPSINDARKLVSVGIPAEVVLGNAHVDLPDTAARDSASPSNNPAVSG